MKSASFGFDPPGQTDPARDEPLGIYTFSAAVKTFVVYHAFKLACSQNLIMAAAQISARSFC